MPNSIDADVVLALRRAAALEAAGRNEEAGNTYRLLLAKNPGNPNALSALTMIESSGAMPGVPFSSPAAPM